MYAIGLVTGEGPERIATVAGQPVYDIFLPNSPNPTAGRLVLVPEDQSHEIVMSVRRGLRLLVTTGMGDDEGATALPPLDRPPTRSAGPLGREAG